MTSDNVLPAGSGALMLNGGRVKVASGRGDFSIFESTVPVNPAGLPVHRHRSYDEAFYVLEGKMTFVTGETKTDVLGPGGFVFVPRGTPHSFANPGPGLARMLVIGSSAVQALVDELAPLISALPADPAAIRAAFDRYDSEIIGS